MCFLKFLFFVCNSLLLLCNFLSIKVNKRHLCRNGEEQNNNESNKNLVASAYQHRIRVWSWLLLHNVGSDLYQTCRGFTNGTNEITNHKNTGRALNDVQFYDDLKDWFHSTLELNEHTTAAQSDKGKITVNLTSQQVSRRPVWERWCRERGWDIKRKCTKMGLYEKREDWDPIEGYFKTEEEAVLRRTGGKVRSFEDLL